MIKQIIKLVDRVGGDMSKFKVRNGYYMLDLCCVGHALSVVECVNNSIGFSARNRGRFVKIYASSWE